MGKDWFTANKEVSTDWYTASKWHLDVAVAALMSTHVSYMHTYAYALDENNIIVDMTERIYVWGKYFDCSAVLIWALLC